jgi:glucokinase
MTSGHSILAGDVGGTHARFALFPPGSRVWGAYEEYESASAPLEQLAGRFVRDHRASVGAACVAVAGAVQHGRAKPTNLPWEVTERGLARAVDVDDVALINDLVANTYGIADVDAGDLVTLNDGAPERGNVAVISAGTGLGEAFAVWEGSRYHVSPSEGGHGDFAPRSELEIELLHDLAADGEHVSYERVCSGRGLVTIYRFLRRRSGVPAPPWLSAAVEGADAGTAITEAGLDGRDAVCADSLALMISIYGAEAGNLALKVLATGGVYLGGGIVRRLGARLRDGAFMAAFTSKGRLSPLLERVPVRVILDDHAALRGAARYAQGADPVFP